MKNEDILEKLRLSGISLYEDISSADLFNHIDIEIDSDYKSNFGFFHLHFNDVEAIILKGVYKDFHRILDGEDNLHESDWATIARTANDCEIAMQHPVKVSAMLFGGVLYIKSASLNEKKASTLFDRRDIQIPRPLTYSEYLLNDNDSYLSDDTILSSGFFNGYFPLLLSTLTLDIFRKASGILNPIFTSVNIKTSSPSVIDCNGSLYMNLTGIEKSLSFAKLDSSLFRLHFATPLYLKDDNVKNRVSKLQLPVMTDEINELIEELKKITNHINIASLIEERFFDYPAWIAIVYEYISFMLIDRFSKLNEYAESYDSCLKLIYKSRKENFFTKADGKKFIKEFDLSADVVEYKFNNSFELKSFDEVATEIGFKFGLFGKKKVVNLVNEIHSLLDIKDEIFFVTSKFITKCNEAVTKFAKNIKEREEINDTNDIFYFDFDELKRLYNGTYFGSIRESLHFRRSAKERYNASVTPSEIYMKDIEDRLEITEKIYSSNIEKRSIKLLSLFAKDELESDITTDDRLDKYNGKVFAFSRVMPYMLGRLKNADGFISESLPLFSLPVEFATLYNIPVYTGLRLAPLICKDKRVKLLKDRIEFI